MPARTPKSRKKKSQDLTTQSIDEDELVVRKQPSNENKPRTPNDKTVMLTVDGTEEMESLMKDPKAPQIPDTFFNAIDITFDLEETKNLEITFSYTMVIRSIGRASPLFSYLLIGDQVVNVNNNIPMNAEEFTAAVGTGKQKITVIRPWNVRHCDDRVPAKYRKDSSYHVVEIHKMSGIHNGFEIRFKSRKLVVTKVHPGTRGSHAFTPGDRILDVDSQNVAQMDAQAVRKRFNTTMKTQGVCSFLVERDLSLKSSQNISLAGSKTGVVTDQPPMGDDACEIGAREATRFLHMRSKYVPKPLLKDPDTVLTIQTTECEDEGGVRQQKKKKKRRRKRRTGRIQGKQETSKMPSDVKDEKALQKVTGESGWSKFVRSILQK